MSYVNDFEFDFEIGDEYEMSPIEGTYVIGRILALGGEFRVDGNSIIITAMPGKTATTPAPEETKIPWFTPDVTPVEAAVEPQPEPAPEVKEIKEAPPEVKAAPIKRAPKPKAEEPKEEAKPEKAKTEDSTPNPAPVEE